MCGCISMFLGVDVCVCVCRWVVHMLVCEHHSIVTLIIIIRAHIYFSYEVVDNGMSDKHACPLFYFPFYFSACLYATSCYSFELI